jgi:hypothetical protein
MIRQMNRENILIAAVFGAMLFVLAILLPPREDMPADNNAPQTTLHSASTTAPQPAASEQAAPLKQQ